MLKIFIMEQVLYLHKADGQENSPAILCVRRNMGRAFVVVVQHRGLRMLCFLRCGGSEVSAIGSGELSETDVFQIQLAPFNQKKIPKIHGKINRGIG